MPPLLKRVQVVGGMGLNTGCWKTGRTYTMTPIAGLVISIFLQPGGNADLGYTVAWAAENALNVVVSIVVTFLMPNSGQSTVTMSTHPGTNHLQIIGHFQRAQAISSLLL